MSFAVDRYVMPRQGATNLIATEAAGVNTTLVPPGWYHYDIAVPIAPVGSPTCVVTWSEAADGSTWAAINPQVTHTLSGTATIAAHYSGMIRVTKNPSSPSVTANLTCILTVASGSGAVFGKVTVALTPNMTSGYAGAP